jgi:hypothetical protein
LPDISNKKFNLYGVYKKAFFQMKKILWLIPIAAIFAIAYFLYGKKQIIGDFCPHATLYLQPYDNFTQKEAGKLKADLDNHLGEILYGVFEVRVLPNKPLSNSFLGETKKEISD